MNKYESEFIDNFEIPKWWDCSWRRIPCRKRNRKNIKYMIRRWVKGRVAVFIDSGNVYFYEKNLGWQIEFGKLISYLKNETRLWKVFFYIAFDPENEKQKKFIEFLKTRGFFVRAKEIKYIKYKPEQEAVKAGFHKGNID